MALEVLWLILPPHKTISMKHIFLTATFLMALLAASAQTKTTVATQQPATEQNEGTQRLRFGYLSCDSALRALPDYATTQANLAKLRSTYDAEMKRVEDEFNQKYEMFLEEQRSLAPSILQKRQAELQELIEKNAAFKEKARALIADAEKEAFAPLKQRVDRAISQIGQARGLMFIINTDGHALPYVDPLMGEDITQAVIRVAK